MPSGKLLLIDDDKLLRRSLAFNLQQAGYTTEAAATAEEGLAIINRKRPDAVILDIGLPGMDGLDALKILRDQIGVPVILLSARRRGLDQVLGLELGADDYITKPFDFDVLLARVKAVLRRSAPTRAAQYDQTVVECGDLIIDPLAHQVSVGGSQILLSPREFDVLLLLAANAGKVISTDELLSGVWGAEFEGQPQVVYVHIRWLREKLGDTQTDLPRIRTIRGVGYKLIPKEV